MYRPEAFAEIKIGYCEIFAISEMRTQCPLMSLYGNYCVIAEIAFSCLILLLIL